MVDRNNYWLYVKSNSTYRVFNVNVNVFFVVNMVFYFWVVTINLFPMKMYILIWFVYLICLCFTKIQISYKIGCKNLMAAGSSGKVVIEFANYSKK